MKNSKKTVIRFDGVSKEFRLAHERARSFQELALSLFRRNHRALKQKDEKFWALRDVSFTVKQGETVGFIGSNGAGKSTALKLMTRIIEPSTGQIEVNGRVSALLELGAGFHPDLTGRENVFMNGSILGLSRSQIQQKMGDIITFAELERFIDIPVKHYSSGMYVRLGFSVAVHTDPEILLIDEVLAVGDQNFQHKCLDRILEMRQQGVTICFVSHGLESVRQLCSHAVWLDDGMARAVGDVYDTIAAYLNHAADEEDARMMAAVLQKDKLDRKKNSAPVALSSKAVEEQCQGIENIDIARVSLLDKTGNEQRVFRVGEPWTMRLQYRANQCVEKPVFGLVIHRNDGLRVCESNTYATGLDIPFVEGEGSVLYRIPRLPLMEGSYILSNFSRDQTGAKEIDFLDHSCTFKVRQVEGGERYGVVNLEGSWEWNDQDSTPATPLSLERAKEIEKVEQYRKDGSPIKRRRGTGDVRIVAVSFLDADGGERRVFEAGEPWAIRLHYQAHQRVEIPVFGVGIHRDDGLHVCGPNTHFAGLDIPFVEGEGTILYRVDRLPLMEGTYLVSVAVHNSTDTKMYDYHDRLHTFKVCQFEQGERIGAVNIGGKWECQDDRDGK
ncbi:MAG: ABC transporter ATP-binding protein [Chloroflexi bacterium]|nr:ABC transporter ATP-binding protein [Chloroflexota bacterium]